MRQRAGQRLRFKKQISRLDQPVEKADTLGFAAGHAAAREQQVRRPPLANDPRQDGARAHITSGKADAVEQERHLGPLRPKPHVGRHRDDGAGTRTHTVDRRDDWLRAGSHRLDQFAGHPREGEKAGGSHLDQWADDLEYVAA
jgi:hypothetical protein